MQHWTVDVIDSKENRKRLKVKVRDVLNLSGKERIVLEFDYPDEPFGEAQGLLAGFCGILATDCSLFPIHFEKWPDLPISYFDHVFDQIVKWSANMLNLWRAFYDPLKSTAQIMENIPAGILRNQWTSFVDYRFKETTLEMCKRNTEIRKKQTFTHTGGSKPNSRRRAEMMAETG
nr:uncharacterized protein LOC104114846 [Nicotiana tomentosiformis]